MLSILLRFKYYRARAFGTAISTNVNVSPNDIPSCSEQIFQVLPTCLVGQLIAMSVDIVVEER